jgi:hypothetical protein
MVSLEHGLASLVWVALIILNFAPFEEVPIWIGFIQSFLQESHTTKFCETMTLLQKGRFTIFARREWEKTDKKAQNICRIFTEIPKTGIKVGENFVLFFEKQVIAVESLYRNNGVTALGQRPK